MEIFQRNKGNKGRNDECRVTQICTVKTPPERTTFAICNAGNIVYIFGGYYFASNGTPVYYDDFWYINGMCL